MIKFKFKYGQNINTSFFIDYQKIKNYHFIFFDNKISIFEEKKETLSRIKLIPKGVILLIKKLINVSLIK